MDGEIFFADVDRGIFGSKNGNLFITTPGTYDLRDDPIIVPFPFRIIVKAEYDPFAVIFTESGYIYLLNFQTLRWHLKTTLPPDIGVIDNVEILKGGDSVILKSNKGSYTYENGWINLFEPIDVLIKKEDMKVNAQTTQLENDICAAVHLMDYEKFSEAMQKYLVYLANYSTEDVFIRIWYDLIHQKFPFSEDEIQRSWDKCISLLATIDRLSSYVDELKMSIGK